MRVNGLFITGTDTGVGKTIATYVLGVLAQAKKIDVGVMKPIQCAGHDAAFLKKSLNLRDEIDTINPCFASEPLSPHLAFKRAKKSIDLTLIRQNLNQLANEHDLLFVEGAGGLMVPLLRNYFVADLIKDLELDVIIVARLGLGTINHTLLTIHQAREYGLNVRGIIFCETKEAKKGIAEETNPRAIKEIGAVPILGVIPYLKKMDRKTILQKCRGKIDINSIISPTRTNRTQELAKTDKKYVWHPFTQMKDWLEIEPLTIDRARGSYLIDTNGQKYLDGVSSLWVNVHGHGHKHIDRAIKNQINCLSHSTLLGLANTPSVELAQKLIEIAPKGLEKVFYSDSGSTAVEIAIKMAYQYWQNMGEKKKRKLVHLTNSYHGDTLGSVSVGGIDLFHKVYRDLIIPTIAVDFDTFEDVIKKRHKEIAAFVVEPLIQGAAGMLLWPRGVLKRMSALCKKYDVILIADEVATGFGRTGKMFACEHEGVTPDIMCIAKGLTAGYLPLAATLTTKRIFDGFLFDYKDQKTFFHGHTYTGNPLACAAALANLEVFKTENTLKMLQAKIKYLAKKLQMFYNLPSVSEIRQLGFMVAIELKNPQIKEPFPWEERVGVRVCQKARDYGVILRPLGNVIVIMPPLSIALSEIDQIIEAVYLSIKEIVEKKELYSIEF